MSDHLKHGSIHEAARQGDVPAIRAFISDGHNVREKDGAGASALAWAILHNEVEAVRCLLELGADPNETSAQGNNAIGLALFLQHTEIVELLCEAGAQN